MWCTHVLISMRVVCVYAERETDYHTPDLKEGSNVCNAAAISHCQKEDTGTDKHRPDPV